MTFTPIHYRDRDEPTPEQDNLEARVLYSERPITVDEIDKYVEQIVDDYKRLREEHHDGLTVVDELLSDDRLLNRYQELKNDPEAKATIDRIRRAVIERLKNRLEPSDYYLVVERIRRTLGSPARVKKVIGLRPGESGIYRENRGMQYEVAQEAHRRLYKLPVHPNIVRLKLFNDPRHHPTNDGYDWHSIVEHIKLQTLKDILVMVDRKKVDLRQLLQIICDGMRGAQFLEINGLLLQDISTTNIGYDINDKKGKLFDMEGIYLLGEKRIDRQYFDDKNDTYCPPNVFKWKATPVLASEMVFQFGICIKEVLEQYFNFEDVNDLLPDKRASVYLKLEQLVSDMSDIRKDGQINFNLTQSIKTLDDIILAI